MNQTPEDTQSTEDVQSTGKPESTEGARTAAADEPTDDHGTERGAAGPSTTGESAPAESAAETGPGLPASLTFRTPRASLLAVLAITACATPLATTAGGWALLIYLLPLALLVWILRTGTTVTAESVTAHTALGGQEMPWDEITSLRVHRQSRLRAVLRSGKQVALPAVRPRDLPRFAVMSGGRLPDPTAAE